VLDESLRSSCFASMDVLCAKHGDDVPYREGLDQGFPFRGSRVPFLSRFKGIHRAAAQEGPAALSINTSASSPYEDEEIPDGFLYAYRSGSIDQPDNRALRSAFTLQTPLVYFVATRPGWYKPLYPCYVVNDDPGTRRVLVAPGEWPARLTNVRLSRQPIHWNGNMRFARRAFDFTKPAFAGGSSLHTRVDARSVVYGRRACSMLRTSSATSRTRVTRTSQTA
jgi:hypothetical protein